MAKASASAAEGGSHVKADGEKQSAAGGSGSFTPDFNLPKGPVGGGAQAQNPTGKKQAGHGTQQRH